MKELATGRVFITSQNHGCTVNQETIDPGVAYVTHVSLNDGTVEGIRHCSLPIASIQFHPQASPGLDSALCFVDSSLRPHGLRHKRSDEIAAKTGS